jgi:hypothetical protein
MLINPIYNQIQPTNLVNSLHHRIQPTMLINPIYNRFQPTKCERPRWWHSPTSCLVNSLHHRIQPTNLVNPLHQFVSQPSSSTHFTNSSANQYYQPSSPPNLAHPSHQRNSSTMCRTLGSCNLRNGVLFFIFYFFILPKNDNQRASI